MIKILLMVGDRKGLIFIHEMTLCSDHEAFKKMAPTDSHQENTGLSKNSQKPCHKPRISCGWLDLCRAMLRLSVYLEENELRKKS